MSVREGHGQWQKCAGFEILEQIKKCQSHIGRARLRPCQQREWEEKQAKRATGGGARRPCRAE